MPRMTGLQLNVKKLDDDAQAAISRAKSVASGEISGKLAEACYYSALETSNRLWEWYAATNTALNEAIAILRRGSR